MCPRNSGYIQVQLSQSSHDIYTIHIALHCPWNILYNNVLFAFAVVLNKKKRQEVATETLLNTLPKESDFAV